MMSRAAMTGRGDTDAELSDDGEEHVGLFRIHARAVSDHVDRGAGNSSVASSTQAEAEHLDGAVHLEIGRATARCLWRVMRARTVDVHSTPVPVTMPSLIAAWGSAKNTSAPGTMTGRWTRLPALTSFWSKSPP
jgi:hypothetical protein